jgi:hypothetical protein
MVMGHEDCLQGIRSGLLDPFDDSDGIWLSRQSGVGLSMLQVSEPVAYHEERRVDPLLAPTIRVDTEFRPTLEHRWYTPSLGLPLVIESKPVAADAMFVNQRALE